MNLISSSEQSLLKLESVGCVEKGAVNLLGKGEQLFPNFISSPFESLLGVFHFAFIPFYAVRLTNQLFKGEVATTGIVKERNAVEKFQDIALAAINLTGAIARFFDFCVEEKVFSIKVVGNIALKVIAHLTGVILYTAEMLASLEEYKEICGISNDAARWSIYDPKEFQFIKYAKLFRFAACFGMMLYSGVSLLAFSMGVGVIAISNMIFAAAILCMVSALFLHMADGSADKRKKWLMCYGRYTILHA